MATAQTDRPGPQIRPLFRTMRSWTAFFGVAIGLSTAACEGNQAAGQDPPNDRIFFPMGMAFHPNRVAADGTVDPDRDLLYVASANSDLRYNGGALQTIDLDLFWRVVNPARIPADTSGMDPDELEKLRCTQSLRRAVFKPGTKKKDVRAAAAAWIDGAGDAVGEMYEPRVDRKLCDANNEASLTPPCRAVPGKQQVIECAAAGFIKESARVRQFNADGDFVGTVEEVVKPAHVGNFATDLGSYALSDKKGGLLMPVRGDPSIVRFNFLDGGASPRCGQAEKDRDPDDGVDDFQCGGSFKLTHLRNDEDSARLPIEPYRLLISPEVDKFPYAFVTHTRQSAVTLINLEGTTSGKYAGDCDPYPDGTEDPTCKLDGLSTDGPPAIVDYTGILGGGQTLGGGYGISMRACDPDDAPELTAGCTRPLIAAAYRFTRGIAQFTAFRVMAGPDGETPLSDSYRCLEADVSPKNARPGELRCDPESIVDLRFGPGGLATSNQGVSNVLGALEYSADGNELFAVQTTPGALLRIDTSVDQNGIVQNFTSGEVEVCSRANELELFEDVEGAGGRFGLVSCYLVGQVYIIDLDSFQAVAVVQVGTGPHHMLADPARDVVYVANTLDATISVIDMNRQNPTRFSEIARLGIQDPFSGD